MKHTIIGEPSYRRPELRRRSDKQWAVWSWRRRPELKGVPDNQLKAWVYSRYQWVCVGVFPTKWRAMQWLGWVQ